METNIPQNILDTPADANGNGFISLGDVWSDSLVGDDGLIYTRKNGLVTVETDDD